MTDGTCSRLATILDEKMLTSRGVTIAPRGTPDLDLREKTGAEVAEELGGRLLLMYILPRIVRLFAGGPGSIPDYFLNKTHYLTPTPLTAEETVPWLALPAPDQPRSYVVLLEPGRVTRELRGPRWIDYGSGIEYLLRDGLNVDAIANVGTSPGTNWPLLVS